MTTRLIHSSAGFLRSLQMSSARVFAFCEGKSNDRNFYSEILRKFSIESQIKTAKEISGNGGKMSLISIFKEWRRKGLLAHDFHGVRKCMLFFLDKDVDDLLHKKLRSQHVIYTRLYDVEAHIFSDGDLPRSIASALGIDRAAVKQLYSHGKGWSESCALLWKEWLTLCLYSQIYRINIGCTFARPSTLNPDLIGETDQAEYQQFKAALLQAQNIPQQEFVRIYTNVEKRVERLVAAKNLSKIFKGKWFFSLIEKQLRHLYRDEEVSLSNQLGERIGCALLATLDYNLAWTNYFLEPIKSTLTEVFAGEAILRV